MSEQPSGRVFAARTWVTSGIVLMVAGALLSVFANRIFQALAPSLGMAGGEVLMAVLSVLITTLIPLGAALLGAGIVIHALGSGYAPGSRQELPAASDGAGEQ